MKNIKSVQIESINQKLVNAKHQLINQIKQLIDLFGISTKSFSILTINSINRQLVNAKHQLMNGMKQLIEDHLTLKWKTVKENGQHVW